MAKKKEKQKPSIISLRALCDKANIPHHKVYSNLNGTYNSLTHEEKTKLANTVFDDVLKFVEKFGFYIEIGRIKGPDQVKK